MRIADVNEFYAERGGGVRTYVDGKLAAAARLGHDLTVIAPGPVSRTEERPGGRIRWLKGPPMPGDPRYFILWSERGVRDALDETAPEVIEGSSPWTAGWFAARYPGSARKYWFFHQDAVAVYGHTFFDHWVSPATVDSAARPFWRYQKHLSHHFDATIVGGHWLADRLRRFGINRPTPIPLGIDSGVFHPDLGSLTHRAHLLRRLGLPETATLLVGISRHHPEKRIGTLLDAVALANREHPVGLVLYGDGPLRRWVERRARRTPHVRVQGFLHDRRDLARSVASADGFLHGSAAETFGLVVAEALAAGTPVIVPEAGGAAELARPEHAETYTPGNVVDCAAAIARLAGRDRETSRSSALAFRRRAIPTMDDHFDSLFALYESQPTPRPTSTARPTAP